MGMKMLELYAVCVRGFIAFKVNMAQFVVFYEVIRGLFHSRKWVYEKSIIISYAYTNAFPLVIFLVFYRSCSR